MRSSTLPRTALAALALTACAGSPTEPAPVTPPPVVIAPPMTPPTAAAPTYRASIDYALCVRVSAAYASRLPAASDTTGRPIFRLDSAGVALIGVPVVWASRDSTVLTPRAGGTEAAGRVGRTWLVGTARGASDSVGVQVVAEVATDCK